MVEAAVRSVGESIDGAAEARRRNSHVAVAQGGNSADTRGERLRATGNVGTLLVGTVGDVQGFCEVAPDGQRLRVIDTVDDRLKEGGLR